MNWILTPNINVLLVGNTKHTGLLPLQKNDEFVSTWHIRSTAHSYHGEYMTVLVTTNTSTHDVHGARHGTSSRFYTRDVLDIRLRRILAIRNWSGIRQNNPAFFAVFITEAAVKRASTPTAAVPPQQELHWLPWWRHVSPGCTRLLVSLSISLAPSLYIRDYWILPTLLNTRHLADNIRTHIPFHLVRLVSRRLWGCLHDIRLANIMYR